MKHKIIITILIAVIALTSVISATAADNRIYYLTDPVTDISYTVTINDSLITVSNSQSAIGHTKFEGVYSLSLCDSILSLYTLDRLNGIIRVLYFDFYNDAIDSTAINADFFDNHDCFASDSSGRVYYVSGNDTRKVCVYQNGTSTEINLGSQINQLICIDNDTIFAFTKDNVYRINGTDILKIYDTPLATPISYIGNDTLTDSKGNEYILGNDYLKENVPVSESISAETYTSQPSDPSEIPVFYFAEAGTTVSKIKKAFADFEVSKVTKANGKDIKSGKLGTGAKVYFAQGDITTIIICGELTGEGNINSRDIKAILDQLSKKEILKGEYLIAADVNGDGKVTTKDALLISNMY